MQRAEDTFFLGLYKTTMLDVKAGLDAFIEDKKRLSSDDKEWVSLFGEDYPYRSSAISPFFYTVDGFFCYSARVVFLMTFK